MKENGFDLVGELHLVVSLRNGAEIGSEADGDVVRVHLSHAALLRQVRQQGEEEGHHLVQITTLMIMNGHGKVMVRLMFENNCANSKHHLKTQSMCLILEEHPRRKFKEFGRYHYCYRQQQHLHVFF